VVNRSAILKVGMARARGSFGNYGRESAGAVGKRKKPFIDKLWKRQILYIPNHKIIEADNSWIVSNIWASTTPSPKPDVTPAKFVVINIIERFPIYIKGKL
jgi:hypothetical protein